MGVETFPQTPESVPNPTRISIYTPFVRKEAPVVHFEKNCKEAFSEITVANFSPDKDVYDKLFCLFKTSYESPQNREEKEWFEENIKIYCKQNRVPPQRVINYFDTGSYDMMTRSYLYFKEKKKPYTSYNKDNIEDLLRKYQFDFIQSLELGYMLEINPDLSLQLAQKSYLLEPIQLIVMNKVRNADLLDSDDMAKVLLKYRSKAPGMFNMLNQRMGIFSGENNYPGVNQVVLKSILISNPDDFKTQIKNNFELIRSVSENVDKISIDLFTGLCDNHSFEYAVNNYFNIQSIVKIESGAKPQLAVGEIVKIITRNPAKYRGELDARYQEIIDVREKSVGMILQSEPELDKDFVRNVLDRSSKAAANEVLSKSFEMKNLLKKNPNLVFNLTTLSRVYGQIQANGYDKHITLEKYASFLNESIGYLKKTFPQYSLEQIIEISSYNPIVGLKPNNLFNPTDLNKPVEQVDKIVRQLKNVYGKINDSIIVDTLLTCPLAKEYILGFNSAISPFDDPELIERLDKISKVL